MECQIIQLSQARVKVHGWLFGTSGADSIVSQPVIQGKDVDTFEFSNASDIPPIY